MSVSTLPPARDWRHWFAVTPAGTWTVYGYMVIWVLGVMVPLLGIVVFSFFSTKGIRFVFDPTFNS